MKNGPERRVAYVDDVMDLRILLTAKRQRRSISSLLLMATDKYCDELTEDELANIGKLLPQLRAERNQKTRAK